MSLALGAPARSGSVVYATGQAHSTYITLQKRMPGVLLRNRSKTREAQACGPSDEPWSEFAIYEKTVSRK